MQKSKARRRAAKKRRKTQQNTTFKTEASRPRAGSNKPPPGRAMSGLLVKKPLALVAWRGERRAPAAGARAGGS